ncbi:unnamed protein product, partial [Gulo gulo]
GGPLATPGSSSDGGRKPCSPSDGVLGSPRPSSFRKPNGGGGWRRTWPHTGGTGQAPGSLLQGWPLDTSRQPARWPSSRGAGAWAACTRRGTLRAAPRSCLRNRSPRTRERTRGVTLKMPAVRRTQRKTRRKSTRTPRESWTQTVEGQSQRNRSPSRWMTLPEKRNHLCLWRLIWETMPRRWSQVP